MSGVEAPAEGMYASGARLRLRGLVQQSYLLWQLTRRDIASRYRGSMMGIFWSFIGPVVMLVVYTFVFSVVFNARWGEAEAGRSTFALNLFAGMLVHGFFAEAMARAPALIQQHSSYVKRVVFPLWILPLVVVGSALFHTLVGFAVLLGAQLMMGQPLHGAVLMLPVLLLPLMLMAAGVGWLFSALGVYVRDLAQVVPVLITVLMFMSPVFYPVTVLPEAYQQWMYLNPLTPPIEAARALLFSGELPSLMGFASYALAAVAFASVCLFIFRRLSKGFADVL